MVGPRARDRAAVEEAAPLMVPNRSMDGAEFVRRMAFAVKEKLANVHFQMMIK